MQRGSAWRGQPAIELRESQEAIVIDTGRVRREVSRQGSTFIDLIEMEGRQVAGPARLVCSLEDRVDAGALRLPEFMGEIRKATAEQSGPVRATAKLEGVHRAVEGNREWLPFTARLYFYAGLEQIRLIHAIVFDGDQERDFIRGLGLVLRYAISLT